MSDSPSGPGPRAMVNVAPQIGASMIRVFLVDDHKFVRRAVAQLVETEPDLTVIGEAGTCREAVGRITSTMPDVAVLDLRLPDGNGVDLCRDIRSAHPTVACILLTASDDEDSFRSAVLAGADGYVLKEIRSLALIDSIRRAATKRRRPRRTE